VKHRLVASGLAAGVLLAAGSAQVALSQDARSAATPPPVKITVAMGEFYFKFSKGTVPIPRGSTKVTVAFIVINKGQIAHNLTFPSLGKATALLNPGEKETLKITFKKKGRYAYSCTVPRHAEGGMRGVFAVK
jgi:uncharacterized cupredoxin-like copper-binding protein